MFRLANLLKISLKITAYSATHTHTITADNDLKRQMKREELRIVKRAAISVTFFFR